MLRIYGLDPERLERYRGHELRALVVDLGDQLAREGRRAELEAALTGFLERQHG